MSAKLKSKGWGPWKYEFYSVCSAHHSNDNCSTCQVGSWINCYAHIITTYIYERNYALWFWWANNTDQKLMVLIKHFLYGKVGVKQPFSKD